MDEAPAHDKMASAITRLNMFATLARSTLSKDWSPATTATGEAMARLGTTMITVQSALDILSSLSAQRSATNMTSVASFPHDVLLHIFQFWATLGVRSINHRSRPVPCGFTAASVKIHWREVALQTPSLWTDLLVDYDKWPNIDDYIDIVLSRPRGRPISLTINRAHLSWVPFQPSHDKLARALAVSRRIECHFATAPASFASSLLPIFQAPMPLLEDLTFSGFRQGCVMPQHVQFFTMSPKLRRIDIEHLPFTALGCTCLENLESFSISRYISGDDLALLCRSCPRLSSLSVPDISLPWTVDAQAFPALEVLDCATSNVIGCLASPQNVPRLHTLHIAGDVDTGTCLSLFTDNSPWNALRVLEVHSLWEAPTDTALISFLPAMGNLPHLIELRISEGFWLAPFFDAWRSEEYIDAAPKVGRLVLRQCSFPADALRALVSFLVSRRARIGRSIINLTITQNGMLPFETELFPMWMLARLEQLVGTVVVDTVTAEVDGPPI
ncbi:hypothetical protein EXIGLDRAFT_727856 [Exidia glandulosa HHB12029]|uniref:F-box domain-containing protein n=1 Tax=Exidia glandulosa HHB12029 TaxID=1314781 RepID=A0A165LX70_EXIGL|nr:hypothetical protein EXIGLDRAFT_727856 [Exidia glandulosa HHB12029]